MKFPAIQPIPLRYAIHISTLAWLTWALSEQLLVLHRKGLVPVSQPVQLGLLIVTVVYGTRLLLSIKAKKAVKEAAWSLVWSKIKAESKVAKVVSTLLIALTQPMVLLIICVAAMTLASNAASCLAMAFAFAGNNEASEQLYNFSARNSRTSQILVWDFPHQCNYKEQLTNTDRKISAVASVYGDSSVELANYYAFLAESSLENVLGPDRYLTQRRAVLLESSQRFGEAALNIYRRQKNNSKCLEALGIIALDQLILGKKQEAQISVANAAELIALSVPNERSRFTIADLLYVANEIGDHALAKRIKTVASSKSNMATIYKGKGFVDATTVAIFLPIIGFIFLLKYCERKILILVFRKRWIRQLKLAADCTGTLSALDKLTTLELYCGRTHEAQVYSQTMLQIALADA